MDRALALRLKYIGSDSLHWIGIRERCALHPHSMKGESIEYLKPF